ncbi:methylated-DNA--[protein]-cysteine S-methyltransferase [Spiroplasma endosymbiont of Polydrusus cervinus]|uniref:methylated-DNA--[protein]-cysteine S-methyltransferase n=1 Tax=Spiroplasma endosymbiont of Polydrusus cervinus TaxID=3066287 RepID=UPI0030CAA948
MGYPQAMRAVGTAIGNTAMTIIVPCHRVLGKNNALRGYRGWVRNESIVITIRKYLIIIFY